MYKKESNIKNTESSLSSTNSGSSSKSDSNRFKGKLFKFGFYFSYFNHCFLKKEYMNQSSTSLPVELIRPSRKDEYLKNKMHSSTAAVPVATTTTVNTKTTSSDNQLTRHLNERVNTASSLSLYKKSLMSDLSIDVDENLGDYDELDVKEDMNNSSSLICDIFNLNSRLIKPFRFSSSNNTSERSSSQSPSSSTKSDYNNRTSKKKKKTVNLKHDDGLLIDKRNQKQYRSAYLDNYLIRHHNNPTSSSSSSKLNNVNIMTKSNKDLLKINNVNK